MSRCKCLAYCLVVLAFAYDSVYAADFFMYVDVRYENGLKKTFLGGPFSGKAHCERNARNVWDNVRPICGNCKNEAQFCGDWSQLNEPYRKVLAGQSSPFVYVLATEKNRIILSGATRDIIQRECELIARDFRSNGYPEARCVR